MEQLKKIGKIQDKLDDVITDFIASNWPWIIAAAFAFFVGCVLPDIDFIIKHGGAIW